MRPSLAILAALLLLLAGCSDEKDDTQSTPTAEECAEQGLALHATNGTATCGPAPPPAVVTLLGVPEASQAYHPVAFTWRLDTHKGQNHAMLTEVRVATSSVPESALAGPESFGTSVVKQEHQDFTSGQSYDGGFRPVESGTYFLRAYAQVEGKDLWSAEAILQVNDVAATGTVHDVTLPAGSAAQGADPAQLPAALGDGMRFVNDDVLPRTFTFSGPADVAAVSVQPAAASEPVTFLVPGQYTYTSGEAAGAVTGTVDVALP